MNNLCTYRIMCPYKMEYGNLYINRDGDGILDSMDNCVSYANGDQSDIDVDGIGKRISHNRDSDGILDFMDNCVSYANGDQSDIDVDGIVKRNSHSLNPYTSSNFFILMEGSGSVVECLT